MSLSDFWPSEANIQQCIKPEAESDQDEVFLAVHQQMRLVKRAFVNESSTGGTVVTEKQFLAEFLRDDLPTGTLLMPVLGSSGVGKSHLVRWLDVQLRQREDRDRRHVIRIPKSSSLKTVLRTILQDLKGPQYERIRKQLEAAREKLDLIGAEERIRSELLSEIRRRFDDSEARRISARLRNERPNAEDEEWYAHGDQQRGLPALLGDPVTSRLFMSETKYRTGVIARIARHLTTDSEDDRPQQTNFQVEDLTPEEDLDLGEASRAAREYLQRLGRQNGQARQKAVDLLNSIIDSALQPLASPTDSSLSEIFLEIRRQLLKEKRELVLLVEDFAVLSGIQGALLDAMIREGIRGGVDACVMRTALAVTAGYDFGRYDTVKTRAVHGWYLDEMSGHPDEEQAVHQIANYVGAYLNSARWGSDKLRELHSHIDDRQWPPNFRDGVELASDVRVQLEAFGTCQAGWDLFPFNLSAIRQFADLYLRAPDGHLRLNPRDIINHILIAVLKNCRAGWARGEFPNESLLSGRENLISPTLRGQIGDQIADRSKQSRYTALLQLWGDEPKRLDDAHLPIGVYEAFRLSPLKGTSPVNEGIPAVVLRSTSRVLADSSLKKPVAQSAVVHEAARHSASVSAASGWPEQIREWDSLLNQWTTDSVLVQKPANELRTKILDYVRQSIDWDAILLKPLGKQDFVRFQSLIYLPNSKGTGHITCETAMCVVCSDAEFADPDKRAKVLRALQGLLRFDFHGNWNYPDGSLDYAEWQNLADRLNSQMVTYLRDTKYHDISGDPVPGLIETLQLSARLINAEPASRMDKASVLDAIFQEVTEVTMTENPDEWTRLKIETCDNRMLLRKELLDRIGVRQGGADTIHGVDASRVVMILQKIKASDKTLPPLPEALDPAMRTAFQFAKGFKGRLEKVVDRRTQELAEVRANCQKYLGDGFDKSDCVAQLKELITSASQLGVLPQRPSASELQILCDEFREAPVMEALKQLGRTASGEFSTKLTSLTQVDDRVVRLLDRFVQTFVKCVAAVDAKVEAEISSGGAPIENAKQSIEVLLDQIEVRLSVLNK